MRVLDLFSGIGGFSLGLERAGMRTVAFCEIDTYCRRVLRKHWPDVPIFGDIREFTFHDGRPLADAHERCEHTNGKIQAGRASSGIQRIDVICGGFPCQDISVAGKGAGITGERSGLWSEYARIIGEVRPRYVIVENVSNLRSGSTVIERWPDRCLCGWAYRWRRVPLHRQAEAVVLSAPRSGNGRQGAAAAAKTASPGRRKPQPAPQGNGTLGWRTPLGADGEAFAGI